MSKQDKREAEKIVDLINKILLSITVTAITVAILYWAAIPRPHKTTATQHTTRTTELLQLQLSKEQVESGSMEGRTSGSFLGSVRYVQGSSEGKPETYVYIRYRADNGDIIDRLIPRDKVRLRDDLEPNAAATVDIDVVKRRTATYEDVQKDPHLCYDTSIFRGNDPWGAPEKNHPLPAEDCHITPDSPQEDWSLESEAPVVIHVPKGAVITTINPNMVPDTAKKQ